jgi:hypothetical protein
LARRIHLFASLLQGVPIKQQALVLLDLADALMDRTVVEARRILTISPALPATESVA